MEKSPSIEKVCAAWSFVCDHLAIHSTSWIDEELRSIFEAYSGDGRHYHDIDHIGYIFDRFEEHAALVENPAALFYAALLHDEVYLAYPRPPSLPSSEMLSMAVADTALHELDDLRLVAAPVSMEFRTAVAGIIDVTHHKPKLRPARTQDERLMADCDWSPLGLPWEEYLRNRYKVRQEYHRYSDKEFAVGRAAFVAGVKEREFQFYLPQFQRKYEKQLYENLHLEELLLRKPVEEQMEIMRAA